ncbi:uncharacterized protein MONBRDRAFT_20788 [Monosiga brevicollis MX1]|uniref:non-specific serine/threonine protein kinase n=1 Tax=Monosiga brevicollis TaxID=81824 RepID=A9UXS0_MONBE|nr:uncharacterized protein MONBRDRAFT_20788 [Monosiga brevicollis MX1]EDQ89892.1 predicted protein [Monosiga brevicollis MX1]|eukprot:XP_001745314.1 hypothetical protein [Monosiga brevicollis MX1]
MSELLNDRYRVFGFTGQGVFSNVVRATDEQRPGHQVAIKILRNNEMMYKAGLKELEVLQKLNSLDPKRTHHCVRLLCDFKHRNHLCLVFENLSMNLREVQKKFGRNRGLSLRAVKSYAQQLLRSLRLMKKGLIIHADIKPDNMLVNDKYNVIKLCDFGSAFLTDEVEITPFLVSRFYRAPEIMMGHKYSHPLDMWALACTLFEAYSGRILFQGSTNNEMLKLIFELKGKPSHKWIGKGAFKDEHFTADYQFKFEEVDKVTKKEKVTLLPLTKPTRDLKSLLLRNHTLSEDEARHFESFANLLDRMLIVDPDKRITVKDALRHPFIAERME